MEFIIEARKRCFARAASVLLLWGLTGCDYHQSLRPSTPRAISTGSVDVQLERIGDDHTTFSVRFLVRNRSGRAILFHPKRARLTIGGASTAALTSPMGSGNTEGDHLVDAAAAGAGASKHGARAGLTAAATSLLIGGLDDMIMLGINEAARGPYDNHDQLLAPGKDAIYTLQFPLHVEGETFFVDRVPTASETPPVYTELPLASGCTLALRDAFSETNGEAIAMSDLELLDLATPHSGFDPPAPPSAVFLTRLGLGPGFGHAQGVGGLEIAGGPRWGKTALAFSGQLGPGFPLAIDARYELVDQPAWSLTTTAGDALWLYPSAATAPRVGTEIAMKWGSVFGYGDDGIKLGAYARGGPVFYRDSNLGGVVEFGVMVGSF